MSLQPLADGPDVVLLQRAPFSRFPPAINQAILLSRAGLKVDVIESPPPGGTEPSEADQVVRRFSASTLAAFDEAGLGRVGRALNRRRFFTKVRDYLNVADAAVTIAFDVDSVLALRDRKGCRIAHFHELPIVEHRSSLREARRIRAAVKIAATFDAVVLPDPMRAAVYAATHGGPTPLVVYNCTRRIETLNRVAVPWRRDRLVALYQGVASCSRGVDRLVAALALWRPDLDLVLRGILPPETVDRLLLKASELGVGHRVQFVKQAMYSKDTVHQTSAAAIGFALYHTMSDTNVRFSAYASNKIWELVAAGVPIIASDGPGYRELIEDHGLGRCVDPRDPEAIARAVDEIVGADHVRRSIGQRGRALHLERFNYERQFAPILSLILREVDRARRRNRGQAYDR